MSDPADEEQHRGVKREVHNKFTGLAEGNVIQARDIENVTVNEASPGEPWTIFILWISCVSVALVTLAVLVVVKPWENAVDAGSAVPPSGDSGAPLNPSPGKTAINEPCALLLPDVVAATFGHAVLGAPQGTGPQPMLPADIAMGNDQTCAVPLADSAGQFRLRLVDLIDQGSTKKVFGFLKQQAVDGGLSPVVVPNLGDEALQAPGWLIVCKGNRVLAFMQASSDVTADRPVSLELMARSVVGMAWTR